MAAAQIVVDRVSHYYRPPRGREVRALDGVSLEIGTREFVALLGPSGCGKSTLLYLIGGFLPTAEGRILVEGKPVTKPGPDRGIVFQHFALFPWKTVRQNVLYGLERAGIPRADREARALNFIKLVFVELSFERPAVKKLRPKILHRFTETVKDSRILI